MHLWSGYFPGDATPIYGVSKTAVMGLVKAAALELGHPKFQIRVNGICPGVIKNSICWLPVARSSRGEETNWVLYVEKIR